MVSIHVAFTVECFIHLLKIALYYSFTLRRNRYLSLKGTTSQKGSLKSQNFHLIPAKDFHYQNKHTIILRVFNLFSSVNGCWMSMGMSILMKIGEMNTPKRYVQLFGFTILYKRIHGLICVILMQLLNEFTDVSSKEKTFFCLWNNFLKRLRFERHISENQIGEIVLLFTTKYATFLKREGLEEQLQWHCANLWDEGHLSADGILAVMMTYSNCTSEIL